MAYEFLNLDYFHVELRRIAPKESLRETPDLLNAIQK
jgi:hypothetical protein